MYETATQDQLVVRGEKTIINIFLVYFDLLSKIDKNDLDSFIIAHLLEMLSYNDTLILINYLFFYLSMNLKINLKVIIVPNY